MNSEKYLNSCLKGILVPWIEQNFDTEQVIFWPDLATSHYTQPVASFLESKKIEFVRKNENAPNLPQARPIERYWALCKREYSKLDSMPKTLRQFKN